MADEPTDPKKKDQQQPPSAPPNVGGVSNFYTPSQQFHKVTGMIGNLPGADIRSPQDKASDPNNSSGGTGRLSGLSDEQSWRHTFGPLETPSQVGATGAPNRGTVIGTGTNSFHSVDPYTHQPETNTLDSNGGYTVNTSPENASDIGRRYAGAIGADGLRTNNASIHGNTITGDGGTAYNRETGAVSNPALNTAQQAPQHQSTPSELLPTAMTIPNSPLDPSKATQQAAPMTAPASANAAVNTAPASPSTQVAVTPAMKKPKATMPHPRINPYHPLDNVPDQTDFTLRNSEGNIYGFDVPSFLKSKQASNNAPVIAPKGTTWNSDTGRFE